MKISKISQKEVFNNVSDERKIYRHDAINAFTELSESEIWKKFKKGDQNAFVYIYEKYFSMLFNYAHRFCQNRDSVKDHIQDLFIDLRKNKRRLGNTSSIKFYLYSSLRRRILRAESKESFFVRFPDNFDHYDFEINISAEQKLISSQMNEKIKETLIKNINQLSSRQKEAILHYYYEGFSYDQISELMGFSKVKHARNLVYRAVKKMKKNIKGLDILSLFLAVFFPI